MEGAFAGDRRAAPRVRLGREVRVAAMTEQALPTAHAIDASATGVLVALAEPFGLPQQTRVCVSMPTSDGLVHLMGRVQRVERGDDFRTYVALRLDEPDADSGGFERERWSEWLDELRSVGA